MVLCAEMEAALTLVVVVMLPTTVEDAVDEGTIIVALVDLLESACKEETCDEAAGEEVELAGWNVEHWGSTLRRDHFART